jgi:ribonuclease III
MYPTALEETIQYHFKDRELLYEAITHSSCFNGKKEEKKSKNEKLEYLGDAILNSIISILLYKRYKDRTEGFLSNARSCLVKRETLTAVAREINLDTHMTYGGKNEPVPEESKVLSNMLESLIGAIYLDGGIRKTTKVVRALFKSHFNEEKLEEKSPKNLLQEYSQKRFGVLPRYRVTRKSTTGFSILAAVGKEFKARGTGKNKKEAERHAARELLLLLRRGSSEGTERAEASPEDRPVEVTPSVAVPAAPPPETARMEKRPPRIRRPGNRLQKDMSTADGPSEPESAETPSKGKKPRRKKAAANDSSDV